MHPTSARKTRHGFTLVELLVVVLIIAILAAIAVPLYLGATRDATIKTARANMQTIANAEQAYKIKNNKYTTTLSDLVPNLGKDFSAVPEAGPGKRVYQVITSGSCNANADGTAVPIPTDGFAVTDSSTDPADKAGDATDGCYIPGVSH